MDNISESVLSVGMIVCWSFLILVIIVAMFGILYRLRIQVVHRAMARVMCGRGRGKHRCNDGISPAKNDAETLF